MARLSPSQQASSAPFFYPGTIDPDHIVTPGIYVHRVVVGERFEKRIERRTFQETPK
jgi:hypothetical protein